MIDINYRFDPINNYLDSLDKINKKYAFINYAEIAYGLGLDVSYGQLNSDQVLSIKTPSLIVYKEELALVVNSDGENITLIYPSEGLITLNKYELEDAYEDKINVINVSKNILTQGNKFSISWFLPVLKNYKNTLFQILLSGLVVQILHYLILFKVIQMLFLRELTLQVLGSFINITILEAFYQALNHLF